VNPNNTLKELNRSQSDTLIQTCSDLILTNAYRHKVESMKRLITINSYRGQRILLALPCRGQRTRTNASTVKRQLGKLRSRLKPIRKLGVTSALPIALVPFKFLWNFALT
jgi:ribosomal protein S13